MSFVWEYDRNLSITTGVSQETVHGDYAPTICRWRQLTKGFCCRFRDVAPSNRAAAVAAISCWFYRNIADPFDMANGNLCFGKVNGMAAMVRVSQSDPDDGAAMIAAVNKDFIRFFEIVHNSRQKKEN